MPLLAALVAPSNAVTAALRMLGVLGVALLLLGAARRSSRRALPAGLALLITALGGLPIAVSRGATAEPPAASGTGTVRILSYNVNGDLVESSVVARLATQQLADLVVLPQIAPAENGRDWLPAFATAGPPVAAVPAIGAERVEAVVLVSGGPRTRRCGLGVGAGVLGDRACGRRRAAEDRRAARVAARPLGEPPLALGTGPRAAVCVDPDVVLVGDFNGTLDDFGGAGLGRCPGAAAAPGGRARHLATDMPPLLAMPVDHVLTGERWSVRRFSVLTAEDASGALHRPILAVLARR